MRWSERLAWLRLILHPIFPQIFIASTLSNRYIKIFLVVDERIQGRCL